MTHDATNEGKRMQDFDVISQLRRMLERWDIGGVQTENIIANIESGLELHDAYLKAAHKADKEAVERENAALKKVVEAAHKRFRWEHSELGDALAEYDALGGGTKGKIK